MSIRCELIDELLKDYPNPQDVLAEDGLLKQPTEAVIGLALRKWHVQMGDKPKLGYRQPEDAYRQRIARLRKELRLAEMRKPAR